jgi:hypothetical protein
LYQRLLYRENYLFKIKFVFFLYLLLSASWKENDLPLYISDIRQILGYRTSVFIHPFPWRLHITITYNLPHLRLWNAGVVTVIAYTPEVVCQAFQTSRHEKDEHGRNWHDSKQPYCEYPERNYVLRNKDCL